jgi:carboxymethylenebutenolidase
VNGERIGVTGFCMGGTIAFTAACKFPGDIKAAVPFYGGNIADDSPAAPLNAADNLRAPVLCFFGERDPYIPLAQVKKIEDRLRALGKPFEIKVYAGADHGFFCDERASYHPESARDAWEKTTTWFARHLQA